MQVALFFVLWGITMMHRCWWSLRFGVLACGCCCTEYTSHLFLWVCARGDVPTPSCRVCAVSAVPHGCGTVASGMRGRTLRAHHAVVVGSLQHCAGWMASIYRCGGLRAYGFYRILRRHTVWVSLLLWPRFMTVSVVFFFSFLFFVWWLLFRSNSN
ncbi:putative retrotransposon hot spot protein (RHS) [Trypanosoma cruzi]|uniref:Putative retrotransposon hot spot protein (RHS) n=1 Tax=Trypanosoma cruzi TaxID=5693 RepID=A0A2V2XGY3_TRYCR|nr:putative retrotransposon hot spot protein (RHS) [Trypanosoma cruzi]